MISHRLLVQSYGFEGFKRLVEPREANDLAVTNLEHVATLNVDLDATADAACDHPHPHRHPVPCIVKLERLEPTGWVDVANVLGSDRESLVAPARPRLDGIRRVDVLDVWVHQCGHHPEAIPLPGVIEPLDQLHVLLRHRLLLEAEVGERAVPVPVDDEPCHLAVGDVEQSGVLRLHLPEVKPARLAVPGLVAEDEHALVIKRPVSSCLDAIALPGVQHLAPALCHPASPGHLPGKGPSSITNSISGSAHSAEL